VLLGFFVLFQLAFLLVSNFYGFVSYVLPKKTPDNLRPVVNQAIPDFIYEAGHGWKWGGELETNIRRWTQLTGQEQAWSLFAPNVGEATGFPAVVFLWDDGLDDPLPLPGTFFARDEKNGIHLWAPWNRGGSPEPSLATMGRLGILGAANPLDALTLAAVPFAKPTDKAPRVELLLSRNEPTNLSNFFRVSNCRVRRYDGSLYQNLQPYPDETREKLEARSTKLVRELVQDYQHDRTLAYLKWRRKVWIDAHPDELRPRQVLLFERFMRIRPPEEGVHGWDPPILYPMARWQPEKKVDGSGYVLEYFDYTTKRFCPGP
jgi:hypothetical protein